ncbi:MAG: hypothetical protein CSB23_01440 [Deltaproteobacteria bacterium]|nr:MAG: hypothetical protein CSB23_01440 [Deltaproteobacteria bacterium]
MNDPTTKKRNPQILWWGRSNLNYSRNRIIRQHLKSLGYNLTDFRPKISRFAGLEATLRDLCRPDCIWVPCFCHKDMPGAALWARKNALPVVFDPLISAYDKQVYERKKYSPESHKAKKLLRWEQKLFQAADLVIADTEEHAAFFHGTFIGDQRKPAVVPVGAEERLFYPQRTNLPQAPFTVLFYGSFLSLQGPQTIVEAAQHYRGPKILWKMVGEGPLLETCQKMAAGNREIQFIPWLPYKELPDIIRSADLLLGIFGASAKAGRVIPNKVYQALACGKPLVTRKAPAYPPGFTENTDLGIRWVEPANPRQLAAVIAELVSTPEVLPAMASQAYNTYKGFFSTTEIQKRLGRAVGSLQKTR